MRIGYLCGFLLVWQTFLSQTLFVDSLFLMNGHQFNVTIIDTLPTQITVTKPEKPERKIQYELDQLYMIKFSSGQVRYYYEQDSTINNWFTREEMWMFMKGERDARRGFKAKGALVASATLGFFAGLTGTFWAPIAPYGFAALSGLPKIRIKHSTVSDLNYLKSDAYILGYERMARQRLKLKSLLGGTLGLIAGYSVFAIYDLTTN